MKKTFAIVAMLAISGLVAAPAFADNFVWFQPTVGGVPSSTGGATASFGPSGSGDAAKLICDTTGLVGPSSCTWPLTLVLAYNGHGNDTGILAWALDLYSLGTPGKVTSTFVGYGSPTAFPAANSFAPIGTPAGGHYILSGNGRARTDGSSNPFGQYLLMDITITTNKSGEDGSTDLIYGRVGTGSFGVEDFTFEQFAGKYWFGPNTPTPENGAAGTTFGLPMIEVNNIPEPATLSLLALGGLALIRRRK